MNVVNTARRSLIIKLRRFSERLGFSRQRPLAELVKLRLEQERANKLRERMAGLLT